MVQNDSTSLAQIQQLDPIYADFTQSVAEMNKLRRALESGDLDRIRPTPPRSASCSTTERSIRFRQAAVLRGQGRRPHRPGHAARTFANPQRELLPGMYVRVLIEQGIDTDAIAVPQQAIQRDAGGGSEVFVVKDDGRVATQPVRTGAVQDGLWLVSEGLKDGDRVVVDGFQFVPGDKVKSKSWIDADASVGSVSGMLATQRSLRRIDAQLLH